MQLINITNAKTLQQSSKFEVFGGFISFTKKSSYTIKATIGSITNSEGTIIPQSQFYTLQNLSDYNVFNINGITIPRAKLTSFSVPSGDWNTEAEITLQIEILQDAQDLTNLGANYLDYEEAFTDVCALIENLSETVSISRGENSSDYSKQLNIKFSNSMLLTGPENPVVKQAQIFAKKIFNFDVNNDYNYITDFGFGFSEDDIDLILNSSYKKFITENIDLINNECSFSYTLKSLNSLDGQVYSHSATQNYSRSSNGITTVSEVGTIQGLIEPRNTSAETGYQAEIANAETRLLDIYNNYNECDTNLNIEPTLRVISLVKTINNFDGTINYSIEFNDDPNEAFSGAKKELTSSITYEMGIWTATEEGSLEGFSNERYNAGSYTKYNQALAAWTTLKAGIRGRLVAFSSSNLSTWPTDRQETHSFWQGRIGWKHSFSSDIKYSRQDDFYKTYSISSERTLTADRVNFFEIPSVSTVLMQKLDGKTIGSQGVSVNILRYRIKPSEGPDTLEDLITASTTDISSLIDDFDVINSAEVTFTPWNDVNFSMSVDVQRDMESV